jgi:helix-turn-helix protein
MTERKSQCDRILRLLRSYEGRFVPLPEILDLRIASHTRRIHELRKIGYDIEMHREVVNGQTHTAYRLLEPQLETLRQIFSGEVKRAVEVNDMWNSIFDQPLKN